MIQKRDMGKAPKIETTSFDRIIAVAAVVIMVIQFFIEKSRTSVLLAGVIIFLDWLWISNIAVLLGAEWNAEIARGREIEAGHPADHEPFMEPRRAAKPRG